jgi:hypothetical protein
MLLDQIPKVVAAAKIKAPVYCLLICYCGEDFEAGWPPFVVLGCEKERQRILAEGSEISYYLWAPDEMRGIESNVELHLNDQGLVEKCTRHVQLMSMKESWAAGRKVLQSVAQRLNDYAWGKILKTTSDFVVAFVDNTGEKPFRKDIKASISEERFADLKARGLV